MNYSETCYKKAKSISENAFFIKKNIKTKKDLSYNYIKYRIFRPLLKLYYKSFQLKHGVTPWTSPASIVFFKSCLTKKMVGLEYGSGKSTAFFADRLKHLTSVEHNQEWYKIVKDKIAQEKINNVDYHYIPPNNPEKVNSVPELYEKYNKYLKNHPFRKSYLDYYQFVLKFPDHHFDFILVDGRARVECSFNCLDKLKPGGIFVLDNSERDGYKPVHQVLEKWKKVNTTTGLTDTTIWFKPLH